MLVKIHADEYSEECADCRHFPSPTNELFPVTNPPYRTMSPGYFNYSDVPRIYALRVKAKLPLENHKDDRRANGGELHAAPPWLAICSIGIKHCCEAESDEDEPERAWKDINAAIEELRLAGWEIVQSPAPIRSSFAELWELDRFAPVGYRLRRSVQ
jgi:hypothetical protein